MIEADDGNPSLEGGSTPMERLAGASLVLGSVFAVSICAYLLANAHLQLGSAAVASAAVLLFVIFGMVLYALPSHRPARFGYANGVTAIRAAIVCIVGAAVFLADDLHASASLLWTITGLSVTAFVLDGLDGYLARRFGHESELGARFDMEVDALLILILSAAALILEKAGWWVLLIGLMRYLFVLAQQIAPRLRAELPPSMRRKVVCAVQVGILCALLLPAAVPPFSDLAAASALALLSYSFAADIAHLLKRKASAG